MEVRIKIVTWFGGKLPEYASLTYFQTAKEVCSQQCSIYQVVQLKRRLVSSFHIGRDFWQLWCVVQIIVLFVAIGWSRIIRNCCLSSAFFGVTVWWCSQPQITALPFFKITLEVWYVLPAVLNLAVSILSFKCVPVCQRFAAVECEQAFYM